MSLKKNIIATYVSQIYVAIIGILIVPLYVVYMGSEAYGLVGFYSMLQAWFMVIDMGLTPTLARQTAVFRGGAIDALTYRLFFRAIESFFLVVALVGGAVMFVASAYIATDWLRLSQLPVQEVQTALQLIAFIISLRWMGGLYRSAISGSEKLVWLSGYNVLFATLRFVGVIPVLIFASATPSMFFSYQLGVAVLELTGLGFYAYRLLPNVPAGTTLTIDWKALKPTLKFSITIAFTSFVWVVVTQTDKLILSKILPLSEYGYFILAVLVASGILVVSGPVSAAILPRMSKMVAEGDHAGVVLVYRNATQIVTVLAGSASVVMALSAETLLWVWTGDRSLAIQTAPILTLYAIGNGILAVASFPYYLQYAKGDLRLHLIGNAIFVVMLVPAIIISTIYYGSIGAGAAWMLMNLVLFILWLPFIHHRFEPGLNLLWYGRDIFAILLPMITAGFFVKQLFQFNDYKWMQLFELFVMSVVILAVGLLASTGLSTKLMRLLNLKH